MAAYTFRIPGAGLGQKEMNVTHMTRGLLVIALVVFWHSVFDAFAEAALRLPQSA